MKSNLPLTGDMIAIIRSYSSFVLTENGTTGLLSCSYDYGRHSWVRTCRTTSGYVYHDEAIEALYYLIEYDISRSVFDVEGTK